MAAAMVYGWGFAPARPANTSLASLRKDYQADYVLMVAESYPNPADTAAAVALIKQLDPGDPLKAVDQALLAAQSLGYSQSDLRSMVNLELRVKQYGGE